MSTKGLRKSSSDDFNQTTVERVLRLIRLMRRPIRKTRTEYAKLLGVSERSVYRYFNLIESLGFVVMNDADRNCFIGGEDLREAFTDEEAVWVERALQAVGPEHPLTQSVLRKLNMYSEQEEVLDSLIQAGKGQILSLISEAIYQRKQLRLLGYHSANSATRTDRLVEPIELLASHSVLSAFEVRTRANKYFRIDRISSAELTDKPYLFQLEHRASLPDMFGFALPDEGEAMMHIKLDLSMRAALFMRTEHPLSIPYLSIGPEPRRFLLEGPIADPRPLERFIRGFPNESDVIVLSGPEKQFQ